MRWRGFALGSDVGAFRALRAGRVPGPFAMLDGGGLAVTDGGTRLLGSPLIATSSGGVAFVAQDSLARFAAQALRGVADSARAVVGDSLMAPFEMLPITEPDLTSGWARALLPGMMTALGRRDSLDDVLQAPYAYLKSWDGAYRADGIAPSIFEWWLESHRELTGELPDVADSLSVALLPSSLRIARAELRDRYGTLPTEWRWGTLQGGPVYPVLGGTPQRCRATLPRPAPAYRWPPDGAHTWPVHRVSGRVRRHRGLERPHAAVGRADRDPPPRQPSASVGRDRARHRRRHRCLDHRPVGDDAQRAADAASGLVIVGVDSGGTKTAVVADTADGVRRAVGPGAQVLRDGVEASAQTIAELVDQVVDGASPTALVVGVAGAGRAEQRDGLTQALSERFGGAVRVVHDAEVAYHAAWGDESGTLLLVGTGSLVLARGTDGQTVRSGGWGAILGDDGSGTALGRAALRATLAALDGGPPSALPEIAAERFGLDSADAVLDAVYGQGQRLASFAPLALAGAAVGDWASETLIRTETNALARQVGWLATRVGDAVTPRLRTLGGLTSEPIYVAALDDALARYLPGWTVERCPTEPADGALDLARRLVADGVSS